MRRGDPFSHPSGSENHRLEFELGAWFEAACGFALVLVLSQMREHGLGPFGRADLHPRRNPLGGRVVSLRSRAALASLPGSQSEV